VKVLQLNCGEFFEAVYWNPEFCYNFPTLFQVMMPFLIAWAGGLFLVPIVRKAAVGLNLFDRPGERKIHSLPIPRIGGVAIYLSGLLGAFPFLFFESKTAGILLGSTMVMAIGFLDDLFDLSPKWKLAGQFLACLILFYFKVRIDFVTDFMAGRGMVALGLLAYPLTLLWVVGITNTINLIDGVDGLAGGIVLIAFATLFATRLLHPHLQEALLISNFLVLAAAFMGALLAFLRYNVFPATIFMGDSGAYFLGFLISSLSIAGATKGSVVLALLIPLIALGLPVLDTFFAILRRFFNRAPIFKADSEHLHHKLLRQGFSQAETTRFLWMVSACFSLLALLTSGINNRGIIFGIVILLVIMIFCSGIFFFRKYNGSKTD